MNLTVRQVIDRMEQIDIASERPLFPTLPMTTENRPALKAAADRILEWEKRNPKLAAERSALEAELIEWGNACQAAQELRDRLVKP